MKRPWPACSWRLAAVSRAAAAVGLAVVVVGAIPACRASSGGMEHEPVAAAREAEPAVAPQATPQPAPNAPGEPTPHADEHPSGLAPTEAPATAGPVVAPAVPTEPGAASTAPVEAAPDAPSDPGAAPTEPAPATAPPEPARKPCRRPGPRAKGPLRELVGLDEAAVRRCLGAPDRTSGSTWHYVWPKGCAYEVTRVVVRFARGTVTRAHADHEITGKHCGSEL